MGDCVKISAKNLHPSGNGSICEDFSEISVNNSNTAESELQPAADSSEARWLGDQASPPPPPDMQYTPAEACQLPSRAYTPAEAPQMPASVAWSHATDTDRALAQAPAPVYNTLGAQPSPALDPVHMPASAAPQLALQDRSATASVDVTARDEEVRGPEIDISDPLYKLLAKQAAEDYLTNVDSVSQPVNEPTADTSTPDKNSEVRSPEVSDKHVDIEPAKSQHELHGSVEQSQTIAINGSESVAILPTITQSDYDSDEEFGTMYNYLNYDILTGNACQDKTILIMAERYLIDDEGLLY